MKKTTLFLTALLAAFMLASCATTKVLSPEELDSFELPQNPTEENAMVYIVRPSGFGTAVSFKVYVDSKSKETYKGKTKGGQYIYFSVQPGSRVVISQAETRDEYTFTAETNHTYYIQQFPRMGILFARNSLVPIDEALGKTYVKKLKPGKFKKGI